MLQIDKNLPRTKNYKSVQISRVCPTWFIQIRPFPVNFRLKQNYLPRVYMIFYEFGYRFNIWMSTEFENFGSFFVICPAEC